MDFNKHVVNATEIGQFITASGKETQEQSKALVKYYNKHVRGFSEDVTTKAMLKGIELEDQSLSLIERTLFNKYVINLEKNKEKCNNGYIKGYADCLAELHYGKSVHKFVLEIKNSQDWNTFENAALTAPYMWQIKSYLWAYGIKQGFLIYTLQTAPDAILAEMEQKMYYMNKHKYISMDSTDFHLDAYNLRKMYDFDKTNEFERIKVFEVGLTELDIDKLENAVKWVREKLKSLHNEIANRGIDQIIKSHIS